MSGGSFNYLFGKCPDELMCALTDLENMRDRLGELGHTEAAEETERLVCLIKQINIRLDVAVDRLSDIWKAVEWFDSGDWGREQVEEAAKKYGI